MGRAYLDGVERSRLCDLLDALGPDAPTVLDGWTTRDLAAHLYLREHDSLAGPGLIIPGPWARLAERHRQAAARRDYAELVAATRSGPRGVFRFIWLRRVPNLNECFVHHEDVRRANGGRPRELDRAMNDALWANARGGAWYLSRRCRGTGLTMRNTVTDEKARVRRGHSSVCLAGEPGELLLFLFGRNDTAEVTFDGPPTAIAMVRSAHFGL